MNIWKHRGRNSSQSGVEGYADLPDVIKLSAHLKLSRFELLTFASADCGIIVKFISLMSLLIICEKL